MKKIMIAATAAAALICTTGGALAGHHHHPVVTEIALGDFCNVYKVTYNGMTNLAVAQDTPTCTGTYGGGMVATLKSVGSQVMLLALQDQTNAPGVQTMLQLSYPFTSSGAYSIYTTTDGTTFTDQFDGTYTVETPGAPVQHGDKPISSVFHK